MIHRKDKSIYVGFRLEWYGSLQGEFQMPYNQLVELIGSPNVGNDGYKTDAQWYIHTPKGDVWIYNYKDGKNYLGETGIATTKLTDWHVGSANKEASEFIITELFKTNVKEKRICEVCETEVFFNTHIYDITGMCGTCSTGEARLNYEED